MADFVCYRCTGDNKHVPCDERHGLTGRTVAMPYEDVEAYHRSWEELLTDFAPETAVERLDRPPYHEAPADKALSEN